MDAHAKKETGLAKNRFTGETIDVYSCRVYNSILHLNPFTTKENSGKDYQKSRYDEECHETRRYLQ